MSSAQYFEIRATDQDSHIFKVICFGKLLN